MRASRCSRELVAADNTNLLWQRDLSISLNRVGDVKRDSGDSAGALASYDESLVIRRRLANCRSQQYPMAGRRGLCAATDRRSEAHHRRQSGRAGRVRGRSGHRSRLCRGGHQPRIGARIGGEPHQDRRGEARDGRCRDGALAALEESLAIRRKLPQTDLTKYQIDVAENLETIGDLKLAAGDKDGALTFYEEMLSLDRTMVANDEANAQWQRNMSISLNRLGDVKLALGDPGRRAQALRGRPRRPPRIGRGRQDRPAPTGRRAQPRADRRPQDQAPATFPARSRPTRKWSTIARQVVETDQAKEQWKRNLAISLTKVGEARAKAKDSKRRARRL